ncbi:MAG: sulfotransferase family 2 domain-containing protein [Xanthomonadales bacterium]|nr:sulfotransferase family 2 domain-containing protein [Xanthomonadales bacterium]
MISHKHQCIFVHIPKCGGTSIENMIWEPEEKTTDNLYMGFISPMYNKYQTGGLQHLYAAQIKNEFSPRIFSSYFKFTVVRNPWDKIVSQFTYIKKRPDLMDFIGMKANDEFKTYLQLIQKKEHVQWSCQYKFFLDENGHSLVDQVYRFENFQQAVTDVLNKLNISFKQILHSKKGSRGHYSEYYDEESKEIIEHLYSKDISMLDYHFESQPEANLSAD